ncbi:SUMF1/EgtB/PvdO family nonheme iron enzyme [Pseudanabaena galeata UHCC 0370]|uniref:SUMF1/EgtB/PvdO family nonheme iron enzyme n=1 Tax=Pseudanabaena galeata UHCC 0370 TaxID=3110310 RepID=A0ABU5TI02_9CYAN|nr:SUMF1/EgtB/PvdO family nonheme iron enzyme [Pseudanabaena galeata]MEA5477825.1 SUMF1/EgtB/PvdO family nonheme iron enzyme [Pseudanabaena galeata UHCC 0370]
MAKKALLIGVSQYEAGLPPLAAAPKDVAAMLRVLQSPELGAFDEVKTLIDPDLEKMQTSIDLLFQSCQKGDLGLLYFSGHGITDDSDRLYLATRHTGKDTFRSTAVSASFIQGIMRDRGYQRQHVLILDCCYSGAFAEGWLAKSADINLKPQLEVEGSVVLTSSTSTQKSYEDKEGELSLYTNYIVQGIESGAAESDGDGMISADELHEYAKRHVQSAKPAMKPEIYGIRQGIKIRLARARVDTKLEYRRLVERYAENGEISFVGQKILKLKRKEWELSDEVAVAIENEVLEPVRNRLRNLALYEQDLEETCKQRFPLTEKTLGELEDLQEHLGLRDEDINSIQNLIVSHYVELNKHKEVDIENLKLAELEQQKLKESETKQQENLEVEQKNDQLEVENPIILDQPKQLLQLSRRDFMVIAGFLGLGTLTFGALQGNSALPRPSRPKPTPTTTPTSSPSPPITEKPPISSPNPSPNANKVQSKSFAVDLENGINLDMVYIPSGKFTMGSPPEVGYDNERPQIEDVNISAFYMGKYEVTQAQWQAIMGTNPSSFKDNLQNPVEVSWDDAQEFCKKLSQKTGREFRLPSEAEWEYACRAGTTTAYSFGDNASLLGEYAWYADNSAQKIHPVGQKKPNPWGLYDMHGNLWEWCQDSYEKYGGESDLIRKTGKAITKENDIRSHLFRGGLFLLPAQLCRSAFRIKFDERAQSYFVGFRIVCSLR